MLVLALELIKNEEGYRQFPYRDSVGKLTIGYGLNLDDVGLSKEEAEIITSRRLSAIATELREKSPIYRSQEPMRQTALILMAYQLGVPGLLKFTRMWGALGRGDYTAAGVEALDSKWARDDSPARARRIAVMIRTNKLPE